MKCTNQILKVLKLDEFTHSKRLNVTGSRAVLNAASRITPSKTTPEKKSHIEMLELFHFFYFPKFTGNKAYLA